MVAHMPRQPYTCQHAECAALTFATLTDHVVHVSTIHGPGTKVRRPVSCWGCATEFIPPVDGDPACPKCGVVMRYQNRPASA
jgi:hypothetical protein